MTILGENNKISYEGEGTRIGLKTQLFAYPGEDKITIEVSVLGVYIMTSLFDTELYTFLTSLSKKGNLITIETDAKNKIPAKFKKIKNIIFFRSIIAYTSIGRLSPNEFIKIRVQEPRDLNRLIATANSYCEDKNNWNKVLLMPEYKDNWQEVLMDNFKQLHKGVRFMPPIQNILNID